MKKMNMIESHSIRNKSEHEKELDITLAKDYIEAEYAKYLRQAQRDAVLPGFRQGKVPLDMVKKNYGGRIKKAVFDEIIEQSIGQVCLDNQLVPVSKPHFEMDNEFQLDQPFHYKVSFEVRPTIEVKAYENLEITVPKYAFNEEDIDKELERLRKRFARYVEPEIARAVTAQDLVLVNPKVSQNGQVIEGALAEEISIPLFNDEVLDTFKTALIGKNIGEVATINHVMPEDHPIETIRGQECEIEFTITGLKERVLPTLDDEFAKDLSQNLGSLDDLKKVITTKFESMVVERNEYACREAVAEALVLNNTFSVPNGMVEIAARNLVRQELESYSKEEAKEIMSTQGESLWNDALAMAPNRLRIELIYDRLINVLNIEADTMKVSNLIRRNKKLSREDATYTVKINALYDWLMAQNRITFVDKRLMEENTVD